MAHPSETDVRSVSLFYLVGLFDLWSGMRTILISSIGAYMVAFYIEGPFMPWLGFVFVMGHMSINHIYRQFANTPDKVDITGKLGSKHTRHHDTERKRSRSSDGPCDEGGNALFIF